MVSHGSLSDSNYQVYRTLLIILGDFNKVVVWIVSTRTAISQSSNPCTNPLVTVPSTPITIGITVTFTCHSFSVLMQGLGTYLSFRFPSLLPNGQLELKGSLFGRFSFLLTITWSGRLAEIWWACNARVMQKVELITFMLY